MRMTRADFLKGMAAMPLAHCFGQSAQLQPPPRPNLPLPKRDDLVLVSEGAMAPITLFDFYWGPLLAPNEFPIASGPHPTVVLSGDGRKLFICFAPRPPFELGQPRLAVVDFADGGATVEYAYPGPLSARGVSMAWSEEGRWLYTLTGRVTARDRYPKPDQGGTVVEQAIIYTFDTTTSQFLPETETDHEFFEGMVIKPNGKLYVALGPFPGPSTFDHILIAENGRTVSEAPRRFAGEKGLPAKKGTFQLVMNPAGGPSYYIQSDGYVLRMEANGSGMGGPGGIDPIAPDRFLGETTVSGDGRLLFVPSGPVRPPSYKYGWRYVDRISTYRMSDLRKIREQGLQRPFRRIWSNFDGNILFATEMPNDQLVFLDADTLWQQNIVKVRSNLESLVVVR